MIVLYNLKISFCFYSLQGLLHQSAEAADDALELARRAQSTISEGNSLAVKAYVLHQLGEMAEATRAFLEAEKLEQENGFLYLYSKRGIHHADLLNREGEVHYALKVTLENLYISEINRWIHNICRCHRVLGDISAKFGQQDEAAENYREALDIARSISDKLVLIEALIARGRWEARQLRDPDAAFSDLNEALEYARAGGYRTYEADIRVALAWAHLAAGNKKSAQEEAVYARQMSEKMSYHWGKVDAYEVLSGIKENGI